MPGKKWIQNATKHKGAFTRKAKAHGMSDADFQKYVLSHKDKFDTKTIREAYLRKKLVGMH